MFCLLTAHLIDINRLFETEVARCWARCRTPSNLRYYIYFPIMGDHFFCSSPMNNLFDFYKNYTHFSFYFCTINPYWDVQLDSSFIHSLEYVTCITLCIFCFYDGSHVLYIYLITYFDFYFSLGEYNIFDHTFLIVLCL